MKLVSVHCTTYTYHSVNVTYANPVLVCCCPLWVVFSWIEVRINGIQSDRWNILHPAAIQYVHLLITLSNLKCSKLSYLKSYSAKTMQTGKLSQDIEPETDCPLVLRFSICGIVPPISRSSNQGGSAQNQGRANLLLYFWFRASTSRSLNYSHYNEGFLTYNMLLMR